MKSLFGQFRESLDDLIDDPTSFVLMEKTEDILDQIQKQYGFKIYKGLNRCYEGVLLINQVRPETPDKKESYDSNRDTD